MNVATETELTVDQKIKVLEMAVKTYCSTSRIMMDPGDLPRMYKDLCGMVLEKAAVPQEV